MLRHYKKLKEIQKRAGHPRPASSAAIKGFKGVETNFPAPVPPTIEPKHVVHLSSLQQKDERLAHLQNPSSPYQGLGEEPVPPAQTTLVIKAGKKLSKREKDHRIQVKKDNQRLVRNLEVIGNTYGE